VKRTKQLLFVFVILFSLRPLQASGQISIRLKPYIGLGISVTRGYNSARIPIGDRFDQMYYDLNLKSSPGISVRTNVRVNVLNINKLSLGYQFWAHEYKYANDNPNNQFKVDFDYPESFLASLHALTLQWTLKYRYLSSQKVVPFLLAGYGIFHGNSKEQHYAWKDTKETIAGLISTRGKKFDGNGFLVGAGATFFKYAYCYIGYVELLDDTLPQYSFFDVTIGVTF